MANSGDKELGMHRHISRRDFINGVALPLGGAMLLPTWTGVLAQPSPPANSYYPPTELGLRGSHAGSFEVGHQLRDLRGWDLSSASDSGEEYDLVIVGGGISGLAAAYFFIDQAGRDAKVLILDNHDDFGGHAKRNEFQYGGRLRALDGRTLNIESPERYNAPSKA